MRLVPKSERIERIDIDVHRLLKIADYCDRINHIIDGRHHDIVQVTLHRTRWKIEERDGERNFRGEVPFRQRGSACLNNSRFPSFDGFTLFGLVRNRRPFDNEL